MVQYVLGNQLQWADGEEGRLGWTPSCVLTESAPSRPPHAVLLWQYCEKHHRSRAGPSHQGLCWRPWQKPERESLMLIVTRTSSSELTDSESSVPEGSEGSKSSKLTKLLIFMQRLTTDFRPRSKFHRLNCNYSWDFPGGPTAENLLASAGTRVPSLVREDPTGHRATKPTGHHYWAHRPKARALQLEKSLQGEAREP